jgi:hypothetical protein
MDTIIKENPHYHTPLISSYQGNPLIEALDPIPKNRMEAAKRLLKKPEFDKSEIELDASLRKHLTLNLRNYLFPTNKHVDILYGILLQIFDGYKYRNPLTAEGQKKLHRVHGKKEWVVVKKHKPGTISFITGLSGMGKSIAIEAVLNAISATVIRHMNYKGTPFTETQIVALKNNVGDQISPKFFAKRYGEKTDRLLGIELYSKYFKNRQLTRYDFIVELYKIICNHFVGIIAIDEFQNIKLASKKLKEELIALLIDMRDELGIPIVLVGTYKAVDILRKDASISRRLVEGGYYELERPLSSADEDFRNFCDVMWKYQWLREPVALTDKIYDALYDCSMGVTGILLNLFIYSQNEALNTDKEFVDARMIRRVYRDRFKPFHNIINALRAGTPEFLNQYDDLYCKAFAQLEGDAPYDHEKANGQASKKHDTSDTQKLREQVVGKKALTEGENDES